MSGTYRDFLRSPYWGAVRRQVLARQPWCERCGSRVQLQVHHKSYANLGREYYRRQDLEMLCDPCHAGHHEKPARSIIHSGPELVGEILRRMGWKERVA